MYSHHHVYDVSRVIYYLPTSDDGKVLHLQAYDAVGAVLAVSLNYAEIYLSMPLPWILILITSCAMHLWGTAYIYPEEGSNIEVRR